MSTRSVADKLLIKPDTTLWSSHAARLGLVEPLPTGVRRVDAPEQATTALVFADDAASLRDLLARTRGGWPVRRSSGSPIPTRVWGSSSQAAIPPGALAA
jgi:hypothetical protein